MKLSVKDVETQAVATLVDDWLEGSKLKPKEIELIKQRFPAKPYQKVAYRLVRLSRKPKKDVAVLRPKSMLISLSETAEGALYGGLSYAHDEGIFPKWFALFEVYGAQVHLNHEECLRLLSLGIRPPSEAVIARTKRERELVSAAKPYKARLLGILPSDAAIQQSKHPAVIKKFMKELRS